MEWECKYCRATTRSRAKSCTDASGSFTSWRSSDSRSPPTQYSRISHRWFVVSYLPDLKRGAARACRCVIGRGRRSCVPVSKLLLAACTCTVHAHMLRYQKDRSVHGPPSSPCVEFEDVLVVQRVHGAHLQIGGMQCAMHDSDRAACA
eukprot:358229-Chlamydomonas_euryale.AAC.1